MANTSRIRDLAGPLVQPPHVPPTTPQAKREAGHAAFDNDLAMAYGHPDANLEGNAPLVPAPLNPIPAGRVGGFGPETAEEKRIRLFRQGVKEKREFDAKIREKSRFYTVPDGTLMPDGTPMPHGIQAPRRKPLYHTSEEQHLGHRSSGLRRKQYLDGLQRKHKASAHSGQLDIPSFAARYDAAAAAASADYLKKFPGDFEGAAKEAHKAGVQVNLDYDWSLARNEKTQRQLNVMSRNKMYHLGRDAGAHANPHQYGRAMTEFNDRIQAGDHAGAVAVAAVYGLDPLRLQTMSAPLAAAAGARPPEREKNAVEAQAEEHRSAMSLPHGQRFTALQGAAAVSLPEGADQSLAQQQARIQYQQTARDLASRPVEQWTPGERTEFEQATAGMSPREFQQYTGLPEDQANILYQRVKGENATWGQAVDNMWNWATGG